MRNPLSDREFHEPFAETTSLQARSNVRDEPISVLIVGHYIYHMG